MRAYVAGSHADQYNGSPGFKGATAWSYICLDWFLSRLSSVKTSPKSFKIFFAWKKNLVVVWKKHIFVWIDFTKLINRSNSKPSSFLLKTTMLDHMCDWIYFTRLSSPNQPIDQIQNLSCFWKIWCFAVWENNSACSYPCLDWFSPNQPIVKNLKVSRFEICSVAMSSKTFNSRPRLLGGGSEKSN